jgi:hypothetical protein
MCSNEREPLGALRDAVAALAAQDVDGLPEAALARDLPELRRLADSVEAQWLRRLEAFDRRGGAAAAGAVSTGAWVRSSCRLAPGPARGQVELARALAGLPDTAAALAAGDISPTHAHLVAAALAELAEAGGPELAAQTEPALVDLARALDPAKLRSELTHVRHALAPEADADAAERAYERRGLSASQTLDGIVALDGTLDPEGGALLLAALQPLAAPAGDDDRRTPRQRRADALVELARRQLDHGDLPVSGGERPHVTVLVPLDTLLRQPGAPPAESGTHRTAPTSPTQAPAGERAGGGPGPAAQPAAAAGPAAAPDPGAGVREPADNADATTPPGPADAAEVVPTPAAATAVWEPAENTSAANAPSPESDAPAAVPDTPAGAAAVPGPDSGAPDVAATPAGATGAYEPPEYVDAAAAPGPGPEVSRVVPAAPAAETAGRAPAADLGAATAAGRDSGVSAAIAEPGPVAHRPPDPPDDGPPATAPGGIEPWPYGPPPGRPRAAAAPGGGALRPSSLPAFGSRAAAPGRGTPQPPRLPVFGPRAAETGWAGPITGEAARRIACDAGITRVITDGPSQPLDVGRRTRTVPPALRTALVVRDRGCVFPGCDRPPPWTDAHHLIHWADGGPTTLDNLALLCRRHHRVVHERRWHLTRNPDGTWTATPPGPASSTGPPIAA